MCVAVCNRQTGSGKSFTMMGAENSEAPEMEGLTPRICKHLLRRIKGQLLVCLAPVDCCGQTPQADGSR